MTPLTSTVDVARPPADVFDYSGGRSRLTIALDFEGHAAGKLLVPRVVGREAEKEMPDNLRRLKERLEASDQ